MIHILFAYGQARSIYTVGLLCYSEETEGVDVEVAEITGVQIDQSGDNKANPCHEWLNTQALESVLYVAFGSARSNLSTEQLHELAEGLEASEQPFLWVLRPPGVQSSALSSSSLNAVVDLLPSGNTSSDSLQLLCHNTCHTLSLKHQ